MKNTCNLKLNLNPMYRAFELNVCPAAPEAVVSEYFKTYFRRGYSELKYKGNHKRCEADPETMRATVIRPLKKSVQWSGNDAETEQAYTIVEVANEQGTGYEHQVFIDMFPHLNANHV
jgi:hypothetical protein